MHLEYLYIQKNVCYLSEKKIEKETAYIAVRAKENRILTDNEVAQLPFLKTKEWPTRTKSCSRFISYLTTKNNNLNILDLGCGNGWFSNQLASVSPNHFVIGLDVNSLELEQATRVFKKKNLQFVYGDIFKIPHSFLEKFDIIVLNGVIQYFSDFDIVISTLQSFLKPNGEIHIIDSPFYEKEEIQNAKKRTRDYYTNLGFPEMANHYFHHTYPKISTYKILYKPKKSIYNLIFNRNDSPFLWIAIFKND
ncbi:MAG: SAM-dependent methyltransferase [Flavobacterium sp.]|uniref:class I SAM-dependent methyltransferase n=1 Tax=Flavobacterium sp. TaxID=239 RepID=UPI000C3E966E|nr:class I SAM-dependent methyltransferase [Flavobacterium sp.]MBF04131.1 SAM-dependent methyltransferase [Flavobacterium sp.]|tara:strand:- start:594 stop:1343 length:750 start_codon:yes stop_codon:yes gene_type:complete